MGGTALSMQIERVNLISGEGDSDDGTYEPYNFGHVEKDDEDCHNNCKTQDEDKNTNKCLLITLLVLLAVGLITGISSYFISPRSDEVSESPVSDEKPHSSIVDEETDNWEPSKVI